MGVGFGVGPGVAAGVLDAGRDPEGDGAVVAAGVDDPSGAVVVGDAVVAVGAPVQAQARPSTRARSQRTLDRRALATGPPRVRSMPAILPSLVPTDVAPRPGRATGRAIQGGTATPDAAAMETTKDVAICAVVACYLFVAVTLDLRLLVLPSVVALAAAVAGALADRRSMDRS